MVTLLNHIPNKNMQFLNSLGDLHSDWIKQSLLAKHTFAYYRKDSYNCYKHPKQVNYS